MAMTFEEARDLHEGDLVSIDGNPEQYKVAHIEATGPARVLVILDHADGIEGLNTYFDERHLGIVSKEYGKDFFEPEEVQPRTISEEPTEETAEGDKAEGRELSPEELAAQVFSPKSKSKK